MEYVLAAHAVHAVAPPPMPVFVIEPAKQEKQGAMPLVEYFPASQAVAEVPNVMVYVLRWAQFVFWVTTTQLSSTDPDAPLSMAKSNDSEEADSLCEWVRELYPEQDFDLLPSGVDEKVALAEGTLSKKPAKVPDALLSVTATVLPGPGAAGLCDNDPCVAALYVLCPP
jgi:hypothetical protein